MAIGDNGTANNNGKLYENTYYSRIKFKSPDSKLCLSVSFRSGLLILDIAELKQDFKYDSIVAIYISPTKARIFADEIKKFIEYYNAGDIVPGKAFGINAGMNDKVSYIGIHANEEKTVLITIGKIDSQGNITESATISLNKEYHFGLEWDNINEMDVSKSYNDMTELNQLYDLMKDFSRSMSGAYGYSAIDIGRFDTARILKKMDPIYDKLGIERRTYNNNGPRNDFFSNSKNVQSNHTSIDDMEEMIGD